MYGRASTNARKDVLFRRSCGRPVPVASLQKVTPGAELNSVTPINNENNRLGVWGRSPKQL